MIKNAGFIGAGKVGTSLGRYIKESAQDSFKVCGYYSLSRESADAAALLTDSHAFDSPGELAAVCDLLFLTLPDGRIARVWREVSDCLPKGRAAPLYVAHCSGSLDAAVFDPRPDGFFFGSIHPFLAVYDKVTSYERFPGAYFTIEGDEAFTAMAETLLTALGNPYSAIDAVHKTLYHAASVTVSNLVCALAYTGMETLKACGLSDDFADNAWRALFLENAENIAGLGPVRALTGPVERADTATVARHLEALSGDTREVYRLLSLALTEIARQKNPERDYTELLKIL